MTKKTIKNTFLAAIVTAVLCVGTVSAHQLSLNVQTTTCSGFCGKKLPCPNVLGCACVTQPGFTTGTCQLIAAKPESPAK
jgi:hypothetical protein